MKFYCDTEKLSSALGLVSRAVEASAVSPHLEGVLLEAKGGSLTLKGNNMEIAIETAIPSNVAEEGGIVVNCKMLVDIVKRLPKDVIEFAVNEKNNVAISCLNADYMVVGLPAGEYPDIPSVEAECEIKIEAPVLKDMINKTIFAVSNNPDEVRKVLKGSLFEFEGGELTVVSMDLARMAVIKKPAEAKNGEAAKFIVPGKSLNDLKSMLGDGDDNTVTIKAAKNQALFDCPGFTLTTRLIDGEYFNYKQVIPKQFKVEFTADSRDFIKTIERAEPIIDDISKNPIRLTFVDGMIKVKCETRLGRVNDMVECGYGDEEMTIGFNYRYIHDAVVRCEDEKIEFKLNSPLNPMIVDCPEDESYMFMVLPVRL